MLKIKFYIFILLASLSALDAEAYKVKDGEVILNDLEDYSKCQADDYNGRACQDALERWVKANPSDVFKAAKLTRLKMNAVVAVPFFFKAFEEKLGDCKDQDLTLAVVAGLNMPESNKELISQSKKIAFTFCYDDMKDNILKEAGVNSELLKNSCNELIEKNAISGLKLAKCKATK